MEQLEAREIEDPRVLAAMRTVPRHRFVPPDLRANAYEDRPLMIGSNQTISQPYIVAYMTQLLHLSGDETVLEIGTGSGYQAAVLAQLCAHVYTIERHTSLAESAVQTLRELHIENVTVWHGDGSKGWEAKAPFDAILVTAAAPRAPKPLVDQLAEGGRMVLPVGDYGRQYLQVWERKGGAVSYEVNVPVSFVPLRGEHGFGSEWGA